MTLTVIFLIFFVAGPFAFRLLTRADPPSVAALRRLVAMAAGCGLAAFALRYGLAAGWGVDLRVTLLGIALIWGAWIGVLAFGAQALRRAHPGLTMRRWTGIIGAVGTTVPWFGLVAASIMR